MTNTPDQTTGSRRPSGLGYVVIAALALTAVVAVWVLIVRLGRASYVSALVDHTRGFVVSEAKQQDDRVLGAIVANILTTLATAVVFITWFAIVVRRLHRARPADFRHGAGWAIGGWFAPVLNLVYPKQMADDAWRAATNRTQRVPVVFHLWWAGWVLGNIVLGVSLQIDGDLPSLADRDRVGAVAHGISAIAAVLAIIVVARLDAAAQAVQPMPAAAWPTGSMAPGSPWPNQQLPQQQPHLTFNAPPGWPTPPPGWVPPPGWEPDPAWPPAPENWPFWLPANPG